jgi:hypothetical protein
MKDLVGGTVLLAVGILIVALIGSIGSRHAFSTTLMYSAAGIMTCAVSMTASIVGVAAAAGSIAGGGERLWPLAAGALFGIFVATPLALTLVFRAINGFQLP